MKHANWAGFACSSEDRSHERGQAESSPSDAHTEDVRPGYSLFAKRPAVSASDVS